MAKLSITTAWNETSAFVKHEAGPLFLIAFGLMTLPGIIFQVILQRMMPGFGQPGMAGEFDMSRFWLVMLLIIPIFLISLWGNLTINVLALRREAVVGSAFALAARRLLPLIGATLLLSVAAAIIGAALFAVGGGVRSGAAPGGILILLFFIFFLAIIFCGIRLMLMTPVAAAEPVGPIAMISRSWALTSGHFWKLLGFFLLVIILFMVLAIVVGAVGGILVALVLGRPDPGSLASVLILLISGIVQAGIAMVMAVMIARIYEQLTGGVDSTARVFE